MASSATALIKGAACTLDIQATRAIEKEVHISEMNIYIYKWKNESERKREKIERYMKRGREK